MADFVFGHVEPFIQDGGVVCAHGTGCEVAVSGGAGEVEEEAVDGGGGLVGAGVSAVGGGGGEEGAVGELGVVVDEVVAGLNGAGGDAGLVEAGLDLVGRECGSSR